MLHRFKPIPHRSVRRRSRTSASCRAATTLYRALPIFFAATALCCATSTALAQEDHWVATWACGPQLTEPGNLPRAPLSNSSSPIHPRHRRRTTSARPFLQHLRNQRRRHQRRPPRPRRRPRQRRQRRNQPRHRQTPDLSRRAIRHHSPRRIRSLRSPRFQSAAPHQSRHHHPLRRHLRHHHHRPPRLAHHILYSTRRSTCRPQLPRRHHRHPLVHHHRPGRSRRQPRQMHRHPRRLHHRRPRLNHRWQRSLARSTGPAPLLQRPHRRHRRCQYGNWRQRPLRRPRPARPRPFQPRLPPAKRCPLAHHF